MASLGCQYFRLILISLLIIVIFCLSANCDVTHRDLEPDGEYSSYEDGPERYKRDADQSSDPPKKHSTKKPTNMDKEKGLKPIQSAKSASLSASTAGVETSSQMTALVSSVDTPGNVEGDKNHYDSGATMTDADGPLPDDETPQPSPPDEKEMEDNHTYYKPEFHSGPEAESLWVDLDILKDRNGVVVKRHEMLSSSHRRAATVTLSFDFPFYGYPLKNITIATGGFLYLGDHVHSWLAATQYIAPLMANFDTSISNGSHVMYADNGTAFTVEWRDVHIQDKLELGNFSFQATLKSDGEIIFAYKKIPISVLEIPEGKHPVKVGLADAYVVDRTVFFIRRRTLYEYHRFNLKDAQIKNDTAIVFHPLPTCISMRTCGECVRANETYPGLECKWCDAVSHCSDGMDRYRQTWNAKSCDRNSIQSTGSCPSGGMSGSSTPSSDIHGSSVIYPSGSSSAPLNPQPAGSDSREFIAPENRDRNGGAGLLSVLVIIALMSGIAVWTLYAYKNPQTSSGQFLIKYRPSRWRFNSGEARYSAASIHM